MADKVLHLNLHQALASLPKDLDKVGSGAGRLKAGQGGGAVAGNYSHGRRVVGRYGMFP